MESGLTKAELIETAEITQKIEKYIAAVGGSFSDWYVGITCNPLVGLFNAHNVDRTHHTWIHTPTSSDRVSRDVERYFLETRGTDGGAGEGDESFVFVYAYLKGPNTDP